MDENDVRTMLGRLANTADTQAPPPSINIRQAIIRGRRGRRMRMMKAGSSTLAVGAVLGLVVALAVPGGARNGTTSRPGTSASASPVASPATAIPTRFNPLVPYASFGWLPNGYSVRSKSALADVMSTQDQILYAVSDPAKTTFVLSVTAKGSCSESGSAALPLLTCPNAETVSRNPIEATDRAPSINGRSAYWIKQLYGVTLFWQYAPGAWSILTVEPPLTTPWQLTRARTDMLIRVAANVKYGSNTTPLSFPFWRSGAPAGWRVTHTIFRFPPSGVMLGKSVYFGPAANPDVLAITVAPATSPNPCRSEALPAGHVTNVTLDGTKAILVTSSIERYLCASDVGGLSVSVALPAINPQGASGLGGPLGVGRSLHLLGPDPAYWTTDPVR